MQAMHCSYSYLLLLALLLCMWHASDILVVANVVGVHGGANLTDFLLQRQKRFVIFQNGGNIKFVIGPILPIDFEDPVSWRSLLILYNIQGMQYDMPSTPLYPWNKWEALFARSLQMQDANGKQLSLPAPPPPREDDTRLFVYLAMERFLDARSGGHGRACLLRSICENAQVQQHVGIFAEVLDIVLTPGKEQSIEPIYRQAHAVGRHGADCYQLFPACPHGANFLDPFLHEF